MKLNPPAGFNNSVVFDRYRALNWLLYLYGEDWDETWADA